MNIQLCVNLLFDDLSPIWPIILILLKLTFVMFDSWNVTNNVDESCLLRLKILHWYVLPFLKYWSATLYFFLRHLVFRIYNTSYGTSYLPASVGNSSECNTEHAKSPIATWTLTPAGTNPNHDVWRCPTMQPGHFTSGRR